MRVLIKYPSKGRPELFKETIKNIHDTISGENEYRIEVTIDYDDIEMAQAAEIQNNTINFRNGKSLSKIHAVNRDMDTITANYDWDILIVMSDDMKFVQKDWDKIMIQKIREVWPTGTDFFAHFNDGFVGEKLPTMAIMGREYYERFFYIYAPCYSSFSCDAEQMFVAQMLGRWHYFPDVLFKHLHPANVSGMPSDALYMFNDKYSQKDTETYFKRLKKLFYVNNPTHIPLLMRPHL